MNAHDLRIALAAILAAAAFVAPSAARNARAAAGEVSFETPVLAVLSDGTHGSCTRLPFTLSKGHDGPLKVLIAEDTPSGSGESMRSSVWLAAVTAAMIRGDAMDGVRITVEFPGDFDGPSAGAMICLSILSALDGREPPSDFAMTGTILPDGTVGLVGGVAEKLRAAAANGIRRVCIPAFERFEKQPDGEVEDLFRIGEKIGLEVIPVVSVEEAYAVLHGLPRPMPFVGDEHELFALPRETEDLLVRTYRDALDRIREHVSDTPAAEAKELLEDFPNFYSPQSAMIAHEGGQLFTAVQNAAFAAEAWGARNENTGRIRSVLDRFPSLDSEDPPPPPLREEYRAGLCSFDSWNDRRADRLFSNDDEPESAEAPGHARPDGVADIAAQLFTDNLSADLFALYLEFAQFSLDEKRLESFDDDELVAARRVELLKSMCIILFERMQKLDERLAVPLAATFPPLSGDERVVRAERLFHVAWRAVQSSLDADVVSAGNEADPETDWEEDRLADDVHYRAFRLAAVDAESDHAALEESGALSDRSWHAARTLFSQVDVFVRAGVLFAKYGVEIQVEKDENGDLIPRNPTFLHHLIRAARARALAGIAECRAAGVPCPGPIQTVEFADSKRDDPSADRFHDVLESYWKASVSAKALLMAFRPEAE